MKTFVMIPCKYFYQTWKKYYIRKFWNKMAKAKDTTRGKVEQSEERYVVFADSLTRMNINSHTCHGAGSTIGWGWRNLRQ